MTRDELYRQVFPDSPQFAMYPKPVPPRSAWWHLRDRISYGLYTLGHYMGVVAEWVDPDLERWS